MPQGEEPKPAPDEAHDLLSPNLTFQFQTTALERRSETANSPLEASVVSAYFRNNLEFVQRKLRQNVNLTL